VAALVALERGIATEVVPTSTVNRGTAVSELA
jgi:hypothetical protein